MKNNRGFTLIELLAVVVILAVIMAIAMNSITGTIANARARSFVESYQMVIKQAKQCAAQDKNVDYPNSGDVFEDCIYDIATNDYNLEVTCTYKVVNGTYTSTEDHTDVCKVKLSATVDTKDSNNKVIPGGKFKNVNLKKYGETKTEDNDKNCNATAIGAGAYTCETTNSITGYFEK